jgi:hypothetical protein
MMMTGHRPTLSAAFDIIPPHSVEDACAKDAHHHCLFNSCASAAPATVTMADRIAATISTFEILDHGPLARFMAA